MSESPSTLAEGMRDRSLSLREGVYRNFFFGWLFRDADNGSVVERRIALQHNRHQAKWLPIYMLRWFVGGTVVLALEVLCERVLGKPVLSAILAIALILVGLFLLIAAICWAFLRRGSGSR